MPDMEFSNAMKAADQAAAVKAKLLFDTYHWTWLKSDAPPSVNEIVETYLDMADHVWRQAIQVVDGETVGSGNAMRGRLTCEFVDEVWSFGVLLSSTFTDEPIVGEVERDENGLPKKTLANAKQLDA